jgi:hypothetical protein
MQLAALLLEQVPVGSFLRQPVPEAVLGRRATALLDDEIVPLELDERRPETLGRDEALEQRCAEGPPDHRGGRRHLASLWGEPVETGLQGVLDRDGHERPVSPLDEIACRLLEEERVATCPPGQVRRQVAGRRGGRQQGAVVRTERLQGQLAGAVAVTSVRRLAELPRR